MEAYFFQYKLDDKARDLTRKAQRYAEDSLGKETVYGVSTIVVFAAQSTIQLHTSHIPYVERTTLRVGPSTATINFGWRF